MKISCGQKRNSVLFTNLSKAFDCLSNGLLTVQLSSFGFSFEALTLVQNYLPNRKQRTKVSSTFSSSEEIIFVVS